MQFHPTNIQDARLIDPDIRRDSRGYVMRLFCGREFAALPGGFSVAQVSRSLTKARGTIRGMHFQKAPHAEKKIVQCVRGAVFDAVVDLRPASRTFGKWFGCELAEEKKTLLFVPEGCAHGFQTLTDDCEMQYVISEFYQPESAAGVRWDDPFFKIEWPLSHPILSPQDAGWPFFVPPPENRPRASQ